MSLIAWSSAWYVFRKSNHVHPLYNAGAALGAVADRSWEISPAIETLSRKAYCLPDQLERVTGMAYTDNPARDMAGGIKVLQPGSRAFLLRNAWLIDGAVFSRNMRFDLHARWRIPKLARYIARVRINMEIEQASIYASYDGNEFFGLWLTDDCPSYLLAKEMGLPVTSDHATSAHVAQYEDWLDMTPVRTGGAFLKEVVMFDEAAQTADKRARFRLVSKKLLSHLAVSPHPGVFILRRDSGELRIMRNEEQVADYLRNRRGFKIVDVTKDNVPTILAACAGAKVIAGVEGSHLIHGIMVLPPGGSVLTLQPPDRFCSVIKRTTDPDMQNFGFVVGHAEAGGFSVDLSEVERTLDLFPTDETR